MGPDDLPRHRHTNSTKTGRCPQLASQPATRTHGVHRKDKQDSPGHVEHKWWGFHTPLNCSRLLSLIPLPQSPSYTHFGLDHRGRGWGVWQVRNGERKVPSVTREAGAERPGPSLGLAVGGEGGAEAQACWGSRQRRHWAISGWYCSTCRVQLENPNRE